MVWPCASIPGFKSRLCHSTRGCSSEQSFARGKCSMNAGAGSGRAGVETGQATWRATWRAEPGRLSATERSGAGGRGCTEAPGEEGTGSICTLAGQEGQSVIAPSALPGGPMGRAEAGLWALTTMQSLASVYLTSRPVVISAPKMKSKRRDEESPLVTDQLTGAE